MKKFLYCKFPNKGAGHEGKILRGALIWERTFSTSGGFLQNETIFAWDTSRNSARLGSKREGGTYRGGTLIGGFTVYYIFMHQWRNFSLPRETSAEGKKNKLFINTNFDRLYQDKDFFDQHAVEQEISMTGTIH